MCRIFQAAALAGLLALFAAPPSYGQTPEPQDGQVAPTAQLPETDHLAEAIKQTEAAIAAGTSGQDSLVVEYAQEALMHAQAVKQERSSSSPNLDAAIKSLQVAVKQGKAGKTDVAMKAAQAALRKLQG